MAEIFNPDNAFFRIMTKVCYVCILSLLWLLCSIPVFTAGASTAALNTVMLELVRDEESYVVRSFFKAFRKNFKQATLIWLILLACFVVVGGDVYFFYRMGTWAGAVLSAMFVALLFVLALTLQVIFQCQAWFGLSLKLTVLNSVRLALGYLPCSAALLILMAVMLYGIYVSVPLMMIFLLFGMGIFGFISAYLWRRVFDKIEKNENNEGGVRV